MDKLLVCYPFSDPRVQLVEGFSEYDGVLGDTPGTPHKGIDYVLINDGQYISFDVYAMHEGIAFQGTSESWGSFVLVYAAEIDGRRYRTVYAHLDAIPQTIASLTYQEGEKTLRTIQGTPLHTGEWLGRAGTSGWTNGFTQLHLELQDVTHMSEDEKTQKPEKLDPYGVYDRASSHRYPQSGESLASLSHAWINDTPSRCTPV